jgi:hypothetical protein
MRIRSAVAGLVLAGALVTVAPTAAPAAGDTQLRIYSPSGTVTLACGLNTGPVGHPYQKEACAEIDAAKGDIAAIPPLAAGCSGLWDPVLIGVTGRWQGTEILYSDFESNSGCAKISHGHLFDY